MIRTYLFQREELEKVTYTQEQLSQNRRDKIARLKREEDQQLSACAELLLIYSTKQFLEEQASSDPEKRKAAAEITLPLDLIEDERSKLQFSKIPVYFNLSHTRDYAACTVADVSVGVDIEYFKVKELMHPDRMLHPEEARLLAFISNPAEKKKYFYECWVSKESYLKNLGIGLIVRPRDFMVHEDTLMIGDQDISRLKGHHSAAGNLTGETGTLAENLSYLEPRYVHVLEPGEIRGTDWKFDAGYRVAVCSMQKDPDHIARLIHAEDINQALAEQEFSAAAGDA